MMYKSFPKSIAFKSTGIKLSLLNFGLVHKEH